MMTLLNISLSNRAEGLIQELKTNLFSSSTPFDKRLIIVPNAAMKTWLQLQIASDPNLRVAFGIDITFIEPAIQKIIPKNSHEPTELSLALALETTIIQLINHPPSDSNWKPLFDYLNIHQKNRLFKRIHALASTLSRLFLEYGQYGSAMIAGWLDGKIHGGWQQLLWKEMELRYFPWNYPIKKLIHFEESTICPFQQLHLFAMSDISQIHHQFFRKIAHQIPVSYYLLSPCGHFWGDMLSDKETMKLNRFWKKLNIHESQQRQLEELLRDNNPLLANFGRLGRELINQIDLNDPLIEEMYYLPSTIEDESIYASLVPINALYVNSNHPLTLLEGLQADMVVLRNPKTTKNISFDSYDKTIQIHAAPKPMRETQVVYDLILEIIHRHEKDETPIYPGDVVVMAPDITLYSPHILAVFKDSFSQLPPHLMDAETANQHPLIQGFLHLINLPFSRWEASLFLRLIEFPDFKRRHKLSKEDCSLMTIWIAHADIRWGHDLANRNELLKNNHCSFEMIEGVEEGTWEHGLGSLLEGLAMNSLNSSIGHIESHQGVLLGKLIHLIRSLIADLNPLINETKLTLIQWSDYLKCLAETYLILPDDPDESKQLLLEHLKIFATGSKTLEKETFTFQSIRTFLEKHLQMNVPSTTDSNLQSVRFCSFHSMKAVPAKVIILMGMQDGHFPRTSNSSSIDLLTGSKEAEYRPSQSDFDRFLFLEAILSARNYFLMTYSAQKPGESQSQAPSLLITELLNYMDSAFHIKEELLSRICVFNHPLIPFHYSYFSNTHQSYSQKHYRSALAYYQQTKHQPINFLSAFTKPTEDTQTKKELNIALQDLNAFIKNPIKVYCNKILKIYLKSDEDRQQKNHEDLLFSNIQKAAILKATIKEPHQSILSDAKKSGKLPQGPFKTVEYENLLSEIETLELNLSSNGIKPQEMFSIEFNEMFQQPHYKDRCWHLPPLKILTKNFGSISLTGHLEMVSSQGLVIFAEDHLTKAIEMWPTILCFATLRDLYQLPIYPEVIFAKSGNKKLLNFGSAEKQLTHLLEYYLNNKQTLSPLLPEWISIILRGTKDDAKILSEISTESEFKPIYNEYLKWLIRSSPKIDFGSAISNWQTTADKLFIDMKNAWFS